MQRVTRASVTQSRTPGESEFNCVGSLETGDTAVTLFVGNLRLEPQSDSDTCLWVEQSHGYSLVRDKILFNSSHRQLLVLTHRNHVVARWEKPPRHLIVVAD